MDLIECMDYGPLVVRLTTMDSGCLHKLKDAETAFLDLAERCLVRPLF